MSHTSLNFDDGNWEVEEECQACDHYDSDEHVFGPGESYMVRCLWPEYDELIEYDRKTPCLGFTNLKTTKETERWRDNGE